MTLETEKTVEGTFDLLRNLNEIPLAEFMEMDYFNPKEPFRAIIFVPMEDVHDSGFRIMKFVLANENKIVGVVGGGSDVAHINGFGGYGKNFKESLKTDMVKRIDWSLDCLRESHLMRLFSSYGCTIDGFIGSGFCFYPENRRTW